MIADEIQTLANMIRFGDCSIDFEDLHGFVNQQLLCDSVFVQRDWEEVAGLLEDLSWLEQFMYSHMNPSLLMSIRSAFIRQLQMLQSMGRIGTSRSIQ